MYEVLIVDDNERARMGIRVLIEADPLFHVIGEAKDGEEAIQLTEEFMPDLVLMDINMPRKNGLDATRIIKQDYPSVKIVILSVSDDAADLFEAIRNGAQGYLVKSLQPTDWIAYLHGIMNGEAPISKTIATRILAEFTPKKNENERSSQIQKLTLREREILEQVTAGFTNRQIADQLNLSEHTVKNHLKNIMAKLHVQNRVQLATFMSNQQKI